MASKRPPDSIMKRKDINPQLKKKKKIQIIEKEKNIEIYWTVLGKFYRPHQFVKFSFIKYGGSLHLQKCYNMCIYFLNCETWDENDG